MTSAPTPTLYEQRSPVERLRSLDGLRGVAALVVVLHHALLVLPLLSVVQEQESAAGLGAGVWLLTHSPLHLVWAGEEAVLIFFVLSGLVLALPATRHPVGWGAYFPRRLVRLYLPVWGALLVAVTLVVLVPRRESAVQSSWVNERVGAQPSDAWHDAVLLNGVSPLDTPLWSLRWEVVFSLLLPLFLVFGGRLRRAAVAKVILLLALVGIGTMLGSHPLRYLPVFGLGVLMAYHADELAAVARWLERRSRPRLAWTVVGLVTVLLLAGRWEMAGLPSTMLITEAVGSGGTIVGAAMAVFLAMHWVSVRGVLELRPVQWLGRRSFSLYLVHEPVVVGLAVGLPASYALGGTLVAGPLLALTLAAVFYRLVESPAHRASQAVGRWAQRSSSRTTSRPPRGRPAVQRRAAAAATSRSTLARSDQDDVRTDSRREA